MRYQTWSRFSAGHADPAGDIYLIGRYYDPGTGQFLSVDPMVEQTQQACVYAGDDPVNRATPPILKDEPYRSPSPAHRTAFDGVRRMATPSTTVATCDFAAGRAFA